MNHESKANIVQQVRAQYGLTPTERDFFLRSEMQLIVEKITGIFHEWTSSETYMEEELQQYGWTPQNTVDTHPVLTNLHWLLSADNEKSKSHHTVEPTTVKFKKDSYEKTNKATVTLKMILENISEDLREEMTGITYDRNLNIVTLQF